MGNPARCSCLVQSLASWLGRVSLLCCCDACCLVGSACLLLGAAAPGHQPAEPLMHSSFQLVWTQLGEPKEEDEETQDGQE